MSLASRRQSQRHLEEKSRSSELHLSSLQRAAEEEKLIRVANGAQDRAESRRLSQAAKEEEKLMRLALEKEQREKEKREIFQKLEEEEQMRRDEEEQERKRVSRERQLMALRQSSAELRELESKIKAGYICKDRILQLKQVELERQRLAIQELEFNRQVQEELAQRDLKIKQRELERAKISDKYRSELHAQHSSVVEKRKEEKYRQFVEEKAMIDSIIRQIMEEDERQSKARLDKMKETREFIDQFIEQKKKWRDEERHRLEQEDRLIAEYAKTIEKREQATKEARVAIDKQREELYGVMARGLEEKERERVEMLQLQVDLNDIEQEQRLKAREIEESKKRIKQRLELIEGYQIQLQEKRAKLQREQEDEIAFRQQMMEKFAEEEKLHQVSEQKRRMRQLAHKKEVDKIIADRREQAKKAREEEVKLEKQQDELSLLRYQVVEQERQRMLREHAVNLLGFLPKGLFRDEKDMQLFDDDFQEKFKQSLKIRDSSIDDEDIE